MPQKLSDLVVAIDRVVEAEPERQTVYSQVIDQAQSIALSLRASHRTRAPLAEIFGAAELKAKEVGTKRLEPSQGYRDAVYFFLGHGSYPNTNIAFITKPSVLQQDGDTFTPCDTGAVEHGYLKPRYPEENKTWDNVQQEEFYKSHLGELSEVASFAGPYLAAHFRQPIDYVRRGQSSTPDFSSYHGLESPRNDRRAWTIELQVHHDVTLVADQDRPEAIVIDGVDILMDIPSAYWPKVVVRDEEDDNFDIFLASQIEGMTLGHVGRRP